MKDNFQYIKQLENCRYPVTSEYNGTQVTYSIVTASPTWELVILNITYNELVEKLKAHFGIFPVLGTNEEGQGSIQSYRNHLSTLNSFLASVGKTLESRVGVELGSAFESSLKDYCSALTTVTSRTKRDRRTHLNLIRRLHKAGGAGLRQPARAATAFSVELRAVIARTGQAPKALAKTIGISPSVLRGWLKGTVPNRRGIATLRRLEAALEVPRDTLVLLAQEDEQHRPRVQASVAHRERLKVRKPSISLVLAERDLSQEFCNEWQQLFMHKTGDFPALERAARGRWRLIPASSSRGLSPLVHRGTLVCPTANTVLGRIRGFLGVILHRFAEDLGGTAITAPAPQTLAWMAVPWALKVYLEHLATQSEQVLHAGQKVFCTAFAATVRPTTGFLWQQPSLMNQLPEAYRPESSEGWRRMCEESHKLLRAYISRCTGVSRNPQDPIANLICRDDMLAPVLLAIARIEAAAAAAPSGSRTEATLHRDALLLSLLLSNPLRQRTIASMTWNPDGSGTLRGSESTGFRIHLQPHHLKNGDSRGSRNYNVPVAAWVQPRLEAYLEEYRGTLLAGKSSPYLFVSSRSQGLWESMSSHVIKLTRRYIDGSPGFGMHAFRHLVATDWLTQHPNDFLTVAELLNDKFDTVMTNYAHLKRDISFSRYEEHINRVLMAGKQTSRQ
ncbi:MAG: hypothetical protein WA787_01175 [Azonexus sp.]